MVGESFLTHLEGCFILKMLALGSLGTLFCVCLEKLDLKIQLFEIVSRPSPSYRIPVANARTLLHRRCKCCKYIAQLIQIDTTKY